MNKRIKQIIFNKLYKDLSHVEIIPHKDSIWFIDRENKYWYLIYKKDGILYWRWHFFSVFFNLFSLKQIEFEPIISEWVEEVLNCKVNTPPNFINQQYQQVEEVLNCKVNTPRDKPKSFTTWVEEVLNCKVNTPHNHRWPQSGAVEEVLNCKVNTPSKYHDGYTLWVEEVLNCKVTRPVDMTSPYEPAVEEVLNSK